MATDISICSNALLMVGDNAIDSLSDGTPGANLCDSLYQETKRAVLRSHPWNCAVKRVALAPLVSVPAFDFTHQFTKPADWLKTLQVGQAGYPDDYASEGNLILADAETLYLRYIADIDESYFDSMLVIAMQLAMAAAIAYPLTASASLRESFLGELDRFMRKARAVDGQDDPSETLGEDTILLSSRY